MRQLEHCMSCFEVANCMKKNLDILTDDLVCEGLETIFKYELELDENFYTEIVPIL